MKPKKVGFYLFFVLVVYAVMLFYVVGLCGGVIGATINYFKHGIWTFNGDDFLVSLKFALVYGVWGGQVFGFFQKLKRLRENEKASESRLERQVGSKRGGATKFFYVMENMVCPEWHLLNS